jgi:hypothetical protein
MAVRPGQVRGKLGYDHGNGYSGRTAKEERDIPKTLRKRADIDQCIENTSEDASRKQTPHPYFSVCTSYHDELLLSLKTYEAYCFFKWIAKMLIGCKNNLIGLLWGASLLFPQKFVLFHLFRSKYSMFTGIALVCPAFALYFTGIRTRVQVDRKKYVRLCKSLRTRESRRREA